MWHHLEFLLESQGAGFSPTGLQFKAIMNAPKFMVAAQLNGLLEALGPFHLPGTGEAFRYLAPTLTDKGWCKVTHQTHMY